MIGDLPGCSSYDEQYFVSSSDDDSEQEPQSRPTRIIVSPSNPPLPSILPPVPDDLLSRDWTVVPSTPPFYIAACSQSKGNGLQHEKRRREGALHQQLIAAATKGKIEDIKSLISSGADINRRDPRGMTALHHAAAEGHFWVVAELMERGADIDVPNQSGYTAVMLAAWKRRGSVVELLLDYKPRLNGQNAGSASSSCSDVKPDLSRHLEHARLISVKPEEERMQMLMQAVANGDPGMAARMIAARDLGLEEVDEKGRTLLAQAAQGNNVPMIRLLLCAGAKIEAADRAGNTPLMQAVLARRQEAIDALLMAGADPGATNIKGESAMTLAIDPDDPRLIQTLARGGADIWATPDRKASLISLAASKGKTEVVAMLLRLGADVRDAQGTRALAASARAGDLPAVQTLLDAGADPLHRSGDGHTAFTLAAANGHVDVVNALLDHAPDRPVAQTTVTSATTSTSSTLRPQPDDTPWMRRLLGQTDNHGRTALTLAAINNKIAMARLLLDKKADPHNTDDAGRNVLLWAAAHADDTMLNLFLNQKASHESVDKQGNTALMIAASNNNQSVVKVLVRPLYQTGRGNINMPNKDGDTALILAARLGHDAIVTSLLDNGADLMQSNNLGRSALFEACSNGHANVLALLHARRPNTVTAYSIIDHARQAITNLVPIARVFMPTFRSMPARDIDLAGNTVLHRAAFNGQTSMVMTLLSAGAGLRGATALPAQITGGSSTALAARGVAAVPLYPAAADIDAVNKRGLTPLCMAVAGGRYETIVFLIDAGANVNHADNDGTTPLWLACRLKTPVPAGGASSGTAAQGHAAEDVVALLLGHGAAVDAHAFNGQTPLIAAAAAGNTGIVRLLIRHGATLEKVDTLDATAVMHAACFGHQDALEVLLNANARPNADDYHRSALTLAAERDHAGIVSLLIRRGANINHVGPDRATALIAASKAGKIAMVRLLISQGARLDRIDADHKDALFYAEKSGDHALVELLKQGYKKPRDQ